MGISFEASGMGNGRSSKVGPRQESGNSTWLINCTTAERPFKPCERLCSPTRSAAAGALVEGDMADKGRRLNQARSSIAQARLEMPDRQVVLKVWCSQVIGKDICGRMGASVRRLGLHDLGTSIRSSSGCQSST